LPGKSSPVCISRMSRGGDPLPNCSARMRHEGSRRISPSCQTYCKRQKASGQPTSQASRGYREQPQQLRQTSMPVALSRSVGLLGTALFVLSNSSSTALPCSSSIQAVYPLLRWSSTLASARSGSSASDLIIQVVMGLPGKSKRSKAQSRLRNDIPRLSSAYVELKHAWPI